MNMKSIPITFDKSHIVTIGEKLYAEAIELIRELVNNAYDADATRVDVILSENEIRVQDNGSGMDFEGLKQYFNIGSPLKQTSSKSPRFERARIGQFGIGKFASLAACERFEVMTQRKDFAANVVFDKKEWEASGDSWHLPMELILLDKERGDGTTVLLKNLVKKFDPEDVENCLISGVPLKAEHFQVFLNRHPVTPKSYAGHRIPILEGTSFGPIHGEIVLLPASSATTEDLGIECRVKGVTIRREFFGMETWGPLMSRVRGEIHCDFVPITSDRTGFITDSEEYQALQTAIQRVMAEVKKQIGRLENKQENRRASRALNEALERVYAALLRNPDLSPFGAIPEGDFNKGIGKAAVKPKEKSVDEGNGSNEELSLQSTEKEETKMEEIPAKLKKSSKTMKRLTPDAVVKRLRFGKNKVACCLDHFGPEGSECFTEGSVIYINRDHPLYLRESKKVVTYTMYIARLLTQELALMKDSRSPRQAFERQSKLLKDAFQGTEKS
ncbi:MAG: ATP-binding protein [Deltaproteobacteria bacterium]|nr:ATP-binding protein [Deltaproteobacteria bacterium]